MNEWSINWRASKSPRKQRKYVYNAPLHIKQKFMHVHLSKDLQAKHNKKIAMVRVGDTVKVLRGQFKGLQEKVREVNVVKGFVNVEKATIKKQDGTDVFYPIHPSNLMIIDLVLDDKKRLKSVLNKNN